MGTNEAVDLARETLMLTLVVGLPILATALVVGLVVSTLQALTQIQEYTLSFVPKIIAVCLAGVIAGPWMTQRIIDFARDMFGTLP